MIEKAGIQARVKLFNLDWHRIATVITSGSLAIGTIPSAAFSSQVREMATPILIH
ncbi:hypothetical protein HNR65_002222 [Desulfosalsimonas propionicica]|uniref:Uncharacterized protein n=1 Tax=Desulfosalsimonas propionicica TaxID=332175 RepID=A0A7W0C9Z3_9BACT|nr:hypothetical protein [Desulfosalsimonas propionicica]MBA2881891.1 hypothetical protein [Desulfosalsimonas propionicica]